MKFIWLVSELRKIPMIKSLLVLVTGTGISQIFPFITAPIVARLYKPEDFGTYAVFYSLATLFTGLAFLDYNNIIIVAPTNQKAYEGMILSTVVTIIINAILLFLVFILPSSLLIDLFGKSVLPYLWIVPVLVFFNTMSLLFYTWYLRKGNYRLLSKNKIILAICAVILQIGIGFLQIGPLGFIIANLGSTIFSLLLLMYSFAKDKDFIALPIKLNSLKSLAIEYKKFPLVSVWSNTLNIFTMQIPQFLINKVFGEKVLGQYSLAQRMISLPIGFISSAIQDVFRQQASNENTELGNCKKTYINTFKIASIVGVLLLIACWSFVPPLFVFVFGSKWAEAGIYVRVLSILFVIRFIAAPLSYILYIKAKQHIDLLWQIGLLMLSGLTLYGGYYWFNIKDPINLLFVYSICLTIWYVLNLWITYNLAKKNS